MRAVAIASEVNIQRKPLGFPDVKIGTILQYSADVDEDGWSQWSGGGEPVEQRRTRLAISGHQG